MARRVLVEQTIPLQLEPLVVVPVLALLALLSTLELQLVLLMLLLLLQQQQRRRRLVLLPT
jgi:hypothetical protein